MRLYRIDQVLQEEGSVSFETLQAALQCSAPTLKRDLRYMREKLGAPIVYSRSQNAYSYARDQKSEHRDGFVPKLPAAWYTPDEMYAFLAVVQLLGRIENDPKAVLSTDMQALRSRLLAMLPGEFIQAKELLKRVKVIMPSVPNIDAPFSALWERLSRSAAGFALPISRVLGTRDQPFASGELERTLVSGCMVSRIGQAQDFCRGKHPLCRDA